MRAHYHKLRYKLRALIQYMKPGWGASTHKVTWPYSHVDFWFWFSFIQLVLLAVTDFVSDYSVFLIRKTVVHMNQCCHEPGRFNYGWLKEAYASLLNCWSFFRVVWIWVLIQIFTVFFHICKKKNNACYSYYSFCPCQI